MLILDNNNNNCNGDPEVIFLIGIVFSCKPPGSGKPRKTLAMSLYVHGFEQGSPAPLIEPICTVHFEKSSRWNKASA
jgi:hypothetical protein